MDNYKKIGLLAFFSLVYFCSSAQSATITNPNESGFMRSEGKIYVVMATVLIILAGLLLYLVRLDRKMSKLEKGT